MSDSQHFNRSFRGRYRRRKGLQHLAVDERSGGASRYDRKVAFLEELLRERRHGSVQSQKHGLHYHERQLVFALQDPQNKDRRTGHSRRSRRCSHDKLPSFQRNHHTIEPGATRESQHAPNDSNHNFNFSSFHVLSCQSTTTSATALISMIVFQYHQF